MTDTPLTEEGVVEAISAGKMLASLHAEFDCVYTSLLKRSTSTVSHVLREIDQEWIPVVKDWRLNERNYGALVGLNKKECVAEHGKDQVRRWRRSWDEPPPPMTRDSEYWPYKDRRYKLLGIKEEEIPLSESLKDVTKRTSVFWDEVIVPQLRDRKRILIVGHENNLRSIIKRLDRISNEAIIDIELPRAIPLVYHLDPLTLRPLKLPGAAEGLSGRYLCTALELQAIAERDFKQVYELGGATCATKGSSTTAVRYPPPVPLIGYLSTWLCFVLLTTVSPSAGAFRRYGHSRNRDSPQHGSPAAAEAGACLPERATPSPLRLLQGM